MITKVKLKCKKCGFECEMELIPGPSGPLSPGRKSPFSKIKLDKDSLDKLLDAAPGASRDELTKLGLQVEPDEWESAQERRALRKFLEENIRICKDRRVSEGEKYAISNEPWRMGDSFQDIDLSSSEVKAMGVDDMRMIPGITLQKKVFGVTKGRDREVLKGVKFINIIDGSGSMFVGGSEKRKIRKALLLGKEIYTLCSRLNYKYYLAVFSDGATRIEDGRVKRFWESSSERSNYPIWSGGTRLSTALNAFGDDEWKDSNVVIISDMDLGDFTEAAENLKRIARSTNSFRIILIENSNADLVAREREARDIFPDGSVKVMVIGVDN